MIRRHRKGCILVLAIALALCLGGRGKAHGGEAAEEPFRVNQECAPDFPGSLIPGTSRPGVSGLVPASADERLFPLERDRGRDDLTGENGGEGNGKLHSAGKGHAPASFRLTFAGSLEKPRGIDPERFGKEDDDTLEKIRALPSLLGSSSPRDAAGAIGDIFRPRLNLEIDF